jgi:hypothetical protein
MRNILLAGGFGIGLKRGGSRQCVSGPCGLTYFHLAGSTNCESQASQRRPLPPRLRRQIIFCRALGVNRTLGQKGSRASPLVEIVCIAGSAEWHSGAKSIPGLERLRHLRERHQECAGRCCFGRQATRVEPMLVLSALVGKRFDKRANVLGAIRGTSSRPFYIGDAMPELSHLPTSSTGDFPTMSPDSLTDVLIAKPLDVFRCFRLGRKSASLYLKHR